MTLTLNGYYTLIIATAVLLLGKLMVKRIKFLSDFNIPEPVAGGMVAGLVVYLLYSFFGISITIEKSLQTAFMLMFFASIGLSADFSHLKAGGRPLFIFLLVVTAFLVVQNVVGIILCKILGINPINGLISGSIALTGGHGTAGAWGATFEQDYGIKGATTLGIACATFGLVAGGVVTGPMAQRLLNKMGIKPRQSTATDAININAVSGQDNFANDNANNEVVEIFEKSNSVRLITATNAIETLAMFAACLAFSDFMVMLVKDTWLEMPQFVWALAAGIVIRNVLTKAFKFDMFDRSIDVFGNAALSLFLAMALLSLKLWELSDLAGPILVILAAQVVVMILYAYFITFRVMGKDYDAVVLSAGHVGFALGSTATAIANMQAITGRYGPSPKAFLIVPVVGAFFVDLTNLVILQGMLIFLK